MQAVDIIASVGEDQPSRDDEQSGGGEGLLRMDGSLALILIIGSPMERFFIARGVDAT